MLCAQIGFYRQLESTPTHLPPSLGRRCHHRLLSDVFGRGAHPAQLKDAGEATYKNIRQPPTPAVVQLPPTVGELHLHCAYLDVMFQAQAVQTYMHVCMICMTYTSGESFHRMPEAACRRKTARCTRTTSKDPAFSRED